MPLRPLSPIESRVLATLMEKARTVPDSYPLTLNSLVSGCNQKTSRDPLMNVTDAQAQEALDSNTRLKSLSVSSASCAWASVTVISGSRLVFWLQPETSEFSVSG